MNLSRIGAFISAVTLSIALSACNQPVGKKHAATIEKIAVFSNLGNELRFRDQALLGGSDDSFVEVPDWKIDDHVAGAAMAELKKLGYENADIVALDQPVARGSDYRKLTDAAKAAGYDTLVMIFAGHEHNEQPYFIPDGQGNMTMVSGYNNPIPDGYGIFSNNGLGGMEAGCVFSSFLVSILDLRSGDTIAHRHSNSGDFMMDDTGSCANTSPRGGIRTQTGIAMPKNAENAKDLSAEYVAGLEVVLKEDMANDLAYMLPRMLPKR